MKSAASQPKVRHRFVVDDQRHCTRIGSFPTFDDACLAIIGYLSQRWDKPPNRAPCTSWKTCGRDYQIIEFDPSDKFVRSTMIAKIDCDGPLWLYDDGASDTES